MALFTRLFVAAVLILAVCQSSNGNRIRPQSNKVRRDQWFGQTPPVAKSDFLATYEDATESVCVDVLANDKDADLDIDVTTLILSSPASHGDVTMNDLNEFCYLPKADFFGDDSFQYEVCDQNDNCHNGLVRVQVFADNDAPRPEDDYRVVQSDEFEIIADVLENDSDVDGRYIRRSTFKVVVPPKYGRYSVTPDKKIKYTPIWNKEARFSGYDTLVYEICDNERESLCGHATLTIYVREKCVACEKCGDNVPTFDFHLNRVHHFYQQDVLSVQH